MDAIGVMLACLGGVMLAKERYEVAIVMFIVAIILMFGFNTGTKN